MNRYKVLSPILIFLFSVSLAACQACSRQEENRTDTLPAVTGYPIAGTGQNQGYGLSGALQQLPQEGDALYGQDASYPGKEPHYRDNGDGTVTDLVTGLMWQQDPGDKKSFAEAVEGAASCSLAGYHDWRLPSIKELYSLILFSGIDPVSFEDGSTEGLVPFIDTDYFFFRYGDPAEGDRIIDAQYASSTEYVHTTMNGNATVFGVNFADGRIKGYPSGLTPGGSYKKFFVLYVRGNDEYGKNEFVDNGDGTVSDLATGLMWMKADNAAALSWEGALDYTENLVFAGFDDWRLPDAKELQSIVDYTRSPATTFSAAIDPVFDCTPIINEAGETDYPWYWTGTTHVNTSPHPGGSAVYLCFGRAMGYMFNAWIDVHGAGAQRSDPKTGDPLDYPFGRGPQGDAIRIYNFVRCVRSIPSGNESGLR